MTILNCKLAAICATTALTIGAAPASAATVNGSFTINSALITNLYSGTLDAACTPNAPAANAFFFCSGAPMGVAVALNQNLNAGPGSGTLNVSYNDATGEITQVNNLILNYRDMAIVIAGTTTANIIQGNGMGLDGTLMPAPSANDVPQSIAGLAGQNGTADADEDALSSTGTSVSIFQHNDAPNIDAPDFSAFLGIVDNCSGGLCSLLGLLALDATRYQITTTSNGGAISGIGGDTFQMIAETGNNSRYYVDFSTAVVPVPAAGWLLLPAVGAVLTRVRRRRSA